MRMKIVITGLVMMAIFSGVSAGVWDGTDWSGSSNSVSLKTYRDNNAVLAVITSQSGTHYVALDLPFFNGMPELLKFYESVLLMAAQGSVSISCKYDSGVNVVTVGGNDYKRIVYMNISN